MKRLKNQKGMALMSVILVTVLGIILVTAMITISVAETRQTIHQTSNMKAYYIARAGADSMIRRLLTMDKAYWDDFDTALVTDPTDFGDGTVTVSVKRTGDDFTVVATGNYRDVQQDVTAVLKYNPHTKTEYTIYSKDPMVDLNIKTLAGTIGSGGTIDFNPGHDYSPQAQENVTLNVAFTDYNFAGVKSSLAAGPNITSHQAVTTTVSSVFSNSVTSGDWTVDTTAAEFDKQETSDHRVAMVRDPAASDPWMILWLSKDSTIGGDLNVTGNNNLMIIVEDSLDISGSITVSGSGNVEIHVIDKSGDLADDLTVSGAHVSVGSPSDVGKVVTYLTDGSQMNLDVNGNYYGCIIGPGATVTMKNGKTEFYGVLYSKLVTINAQPSLTYRTPSSPNLIRLESIQFAYWD